MGEPRKLHVAMFPWLAFGHIVPFLELANLVAKRGHRISFLSTPRNIKRFSNLPFDLAPQIDLVSLPLPRIEGLPEDGEATTDLLPHQVPYLKMACDGLQPSVVQFLETSSPDWIIYDFAPFWLPPIAAKLGISRAYFSIFGAWTVSFFGPSSSAMIQGEDPRSEPEHFTVPPKWVPFSSKVAYRLHEAKHCFSNHLEANVSGVSDIHRVGYAIAGSDVLAIRSCVELEGDFLRLVGELHSKPTFPVGLLPPSGATLGYGEEKNWLPIREWLDEQKKGSVVYIAFGSENTMSQAELTELALGLELSGLPFCWILRKQQNSFEKDQSPKLPDGFEERVKGRGLVWTTWAPQLKILAHESVGGFLTHTGYSSVIEALYFGRALIMLPFAIDQGLIARVFGELKVGMEVPRDEEDGSYTRNAVAESLKLVMSDQEGATYRETAMKMCNIFGDKDLHDQYAYKFLEFLENHRAHVKGLTTI